MVAAAERLAVEGLMLVAMAIMPFMAIAITFEVIVRRLFSAPTIWVVDASGYSLLWVAFLTAPWLIRHEGHIRLTFVVDHLGRRAQAIVAVITSLAGAAVMVVMLWMTTIATIDSYVRTVRTVGTWEIPQFLIWIVMPVGSLFAANEFVRSAWLSAAQARGEKPPPEPDAETSLGQVI